jgi:hypothetical protein
MRLRDARRIGPGDDLGDIEDWEINEGTIDLRTSRGFTLSLEGIDLSVVRRALDSLSKGLGGEM